MPSGDAKTTKRKGGLMDPPVKKVVAPAATETTTNSGAQPLRA